MSPFVLFFFRLIPRCGVRGDFTLQELPSLSKYPRVLALPKERPTSGEPVLPAALANDWALRTPGLQDGVAR